MPLSKTDLLTAIEDVLWRALENGCTPQEVRDMCAAAIQDYEEEQA